MGLNSALVWLTLVSSMAVLGSLMRGKWLSRLPWLAWLILLQGVVLQVLTLALSNRHRLYPNIFLAGTLLGCVLILAAVLELAETIFAGYPGLRTTSRLAVRLAAAGAALFGLFAAWTALGPTTTTYHLWFTLTLAVQRGLMLSLTLFLLVLLGVMAVLRAKLPRPQLAYAAVFCAFFLAKASALLYYEWAGAAAVPSVRSALMGMQVLCLFAWVAIFTSWSRDSWIPESSTPALADSEDVLIQRINNANEALDRLYRR